MRNLFASISAAAIVAALGSPAFAQAPAPAAKARPAPVEQVMIITTSPDGRVYASDMRVATSPAGHKLEKLNVDEKSTGSQRFSGDRLKSWLAANKPVGQSTCSMEFLTFRVKGSVAQLTGTHGTCAKQVAKTGKLIACPQDPRKLYTLWDGETAPTACPIPTQR